MLGTQPDLVREYVETGILRIVFWPVLNHGNPSLYSTISFECAGRQDINLAWELHDRLFQNQRELYAADMDYYVNLAAEVGADSETFRACYTSQEALDLVMNLDRIRQERGVYGQPIFDINGQGVLLGSQPFDVFAGVIEQVLGE